MNYKNESDEELLNKKIIEEDEVKKKYDKKIGDIKFNRGVNFSIEYLKNNEINMIKFENLDYPKRAKNISLYYSEEYNSFNAITYDSANNESKKDFNLIKDLEKKYKLNIVVSEIEKAYSEYQEELNAINEKYENIKNQSILDSPELEIKKSEN